MMKKTNKHKLPQVVVNALSSNEYVGGKGYSATTLLSPPQQVALESRHGRDKQDVMDAFKSMLGTAGHNVLEKYAEEDAITELRIQDIVGGEAISGQMDHYKDGTISDYKFTSVWKYVQKDFVEWEKQLNTYAYLCKHNADGPMEVEKIQVIAFFWDWSEMKALQNKDYPQQPIVVVPLKLWGDIEQYQYIKDRVDKHSSTSGLCDDELPECTDKERWYTGTKYAVMKNKNVRASRVLDTSEEADEWLAKQDLAHKWRIEKRPGEHKKCQKYCTVASKCQQWKKIQDES